MCRVHRFIRRALAALMLVFFVQMNAVAAPLQVAVILSEEGKAYREFAAALREQLDKSSYALVVADSAALAGPADLYVAVGMKATASLAHGSQPVLSVLTPRAGIEALGPAPHLAALHIEQPIARQLALISAALPHVRRIGVLYAFPPYELAELQRAAAAASLIMQTRRVVEPAQLAASLTELLRESDVLLVMPDAAVYRPDTIRNILLETYRQRIPVIGISPQYVRAGALCAVYSTPGQVARQAALAIANFADTGHLPPSGFVQDFEVAVNTRVAHSLGLAIPDAGQLRTSIGGQ